MIKKLNWYDIRETEKIKIKTEDLQKINRCIDNKIGLTYDTETLKVYNEAGGYIADIVEILKD